MEEAVVHQDLPGLRHQHHRRLVVACEDADRRHLHRRQVVVVLRHQLNAQTDGAWTELMTGEV
jgi:hypothetical protein